MFELLDFEMATNRHDFMCGHNSVGVMLDGWVQLIQNSTPISKQVSVNITKVRRFQLNY